ncbi:type II secretion system F family protein [Aeromicrobium duanguangcaii]|uniref:Type II secretion system F family protein n=1 Tax=Aeromicrobium duanguangcaii TaxID=2968086 RepID=A0ABY5KFT9_9ACTN|nr:type II secretion system F family protein [Aeromicrobium duanguangcaii]MCD9154214.1 type II secretion system F family protein [Aeromicrobium duanguangcaii]UUI68715.1 type II secretion system F family protein [Aeromicrobium duanguangcaii]
MTVLCAALVFAAVLVWRPPWSWVRVRVTAARWPRPGRREGVGAVIGMLCLSLVLLPAAPTIVAWTVVAIGASAATRWGRTRARQRRTRVREECQGVIDGLVTELRSGVPPVVALQRAAADTGALGSAATAAAGGGDVPAALVAEGRRDGAHPLTEIGRAWAVAESCGAPLTPTLERVRETLREERELERELASGVAPARATAALMVAMPPLGLGLGSGLGVDPLRVVLTTVPGALCVAVGVGFALAGVRWIELIADRVETGS